jgi:hypothetical protein
LERKDEGEDFRGMGVVENGWRDLLDFRELGRDFNRGCLLEDWAKSSGVKS